MVLIHVLNTIEHSLQSEASSLNKPAFYHHAGNSTFQIDYILVQDKTLVSTYTILDQSPICSSADAPVKAMLTIAILNACYSLNQRQKKIVKLNWDKAERQLYRH